MANVQPTEVLNKALDVMYRNQTQIATWYVGLIQNDNFTGLAAGDTMASHAGWEECTTYDEAARPAITFGAASGGAIANGTPVEFTMNASKTVKGFFLTSVSTKGGTTGVLGPITLFAGGDRSVVDDDVLKVTATVEAEDTNV